MDEIEVDASLRLVIGLLDDLFGGRARLHLFDRANRSLRSVGADEPEIHAPGPLHRAMGSSDTLVEHIGVEVPSSWSPSYRAWIPRGECHLTAARIEGGGEVVGVLSVLRSQNTRVPVAEDRALIGALAARLGRSAAVTLARSLTPVDSTPDPDPEPDDPELDEPELDESEPDESERVNRNLEARWSPPDRTGSVLGAQPTTISPVAHRLADDPGTAADRALRAAVDALGIPPEQVEAVLTTPDAPVDPDADVLLEVLGELSGHVVGNVPASGLRLEITRSGPDWVASIRPRALEDGWPRRPIVPDNVARLAHDRGGEADIVADPELGWLIEVRTGALASSPTPDDPVLPATAAVAPAAAAEPSAAELPQGVDLMAASLGDTSHMVMLAVSHDGRVVFCNDELAIRLGGSVADLLGRPLASARGSSGAWSDFERLFGRVDVDGLAQQTLSWPHPEDGPRLIRWTVSRSQGPDSASVYLCFGVDVGVDSLVSDS